MSHDFSERSIAHPYVSGNQNYFDRFHRHAGASPQEISTFITSAVNETIRAVDMGFHGIIRANQLTRAAKQILANVKPLADVAPKKVSEGFAKKKKR